MVPNQKKRIGVSNKAEMRDSALKMTDTNQRPGGRYQLIVAGIAVLLLAAVVIVGRSGFLSPHTQTSEVSKTSEVLPPDAVAPSVYLADLSPSAAYLIVTSAGLVLVDSGIERDGATLTALIRGWGFDINQLRAVLLTHAHGDHTLGAGHFREVTGAKIYAGRGDAQVLRDGAPREAFFSMFAMPGIEIHPTQVDVELSGGEQIEFGDARFQAIATPGHTPGSMCYLLEQDDQRILFTGDTIETLTGNRPTYSIYLAPRYRGNADAYLGSLKKLLDLPAPDLILVGHPKSEILTRRRLTLAQWRSLLENLIGETRDLVQRYQTDGANFLDGVPKRILPGLYYLGDYRESALYCLISEPSKLFLFDAPGGPDLVEVLKSRLQELGLPWTALVAVLLTSCGPEATGGLRTLVEKTHCQVVASKAGLAAVKDLCPAGTVIRSEQELEMNTGLSVETIPLQGRGLAPIAYQVQWQGRKVLVSGRIPSKVGAQVKEEMAKVLSQPGGDATRYRQSLDKLAACNPDIWLPAVPVNGQNANLYGDDWANTLAQNALMIPSGK
jgi:glyoxylase-like metal-dependent hydrolase (beta-lactamase superfamily II)